MCEQTALNYANAAATADPEGWGSSVERARTAGHQLAHDERIQAAIREEGQRRIGAGVSIATNMLIQIAEGKHGASVKERLTAISMTLNRAGLHEKSEHHIHTSREPTELEQVETVKQLAGMLGVDAAVLLGKVGFRGAPVQIESQPTAGEQSNTLDEWIGEL